MPLFAVIALALQTPFANEIAAFEAMDKMNPPQLGQILFIGSSSFTNWKTLQKDYPNHKILNRAFGGSSLPHMTLYAEQTIFKYKPKQVVIYCGENDLAGNPKLPAHEVYQRVVALHKLIRTRLPNTSIAYVGMKPSPARWSIRAKYVAANGWIRDFCMKSINTQYIDVWPTMLNERGLPRPEIFTKDNLHMNAKGYALWIPIIEPFLIRQS